MIDVAAVGDVLDINCWSNIPYHFFKTGKEMGMLDNPWRLDVSSVNASRKLWNLKSLLSMNGIGGYQFSDDFLSKAERKIPTDFFQHTVISFNQSFPRALTVNGAGGKVYYYIDMTLKNLFEDPHYKTKVGKGAANAALARETANYEKAEMVVTMGSWPLQTLRDFYNIPEHKLTNILPGANITLPKHWLPKPMLEGAGVSRDLILGFIGKDWERKGLGVVMEVKSALSRKGYKIKVKVIGNCPSKWRKDPDIIFLGFIDKQKQNDLFLEEISSCDLGCLFSKGEALGISALEFLISGVPLIGYYHQGLKDTLFPDASIQCGLAESISTISEKIEAYLLNKDLQLKLKKGAMRRATEVSWGSTLTKWLKLLS